MSGIFITGTDTGVGKSVICGCLAGYLRQRGVGVITQKWVQTGCRGVSEDLLLHRELGGFAEAPGSDALLNPYSFSFPASPHLAAEREGRAIEPEVIADAYRQLEARHELVLVEGAGGLLVPLTRTMLMADLVAQLGMPTIVVVRNGLGCINHALLTIEALRQRNIPLLGLVFNRMTSDEDEEIPRDNPRTIAEMGGVKVLGEMPYLSSLSDAAAHFAPIGQACWEAWKALVAHA